ERYSITIRNKRIQYPPILSLRGVLDGESYGSKVERISLRPDMPSCPISLQARPLEAWSEEGTLGAIIGLAPAVAPSAFLAGLVCGRLHYLRKCKRLRHRVRTRALPLASARSSLRGCRWRTARCRGT